MEQGLYLSKNRVEEMQCENSQSDKKHIRKAILAARDKIGPEERERATVAITACICSHPWFEESEVLLAFVSYGSEIGTEGIITEALKRGKRVYVPRVDGDMEFFRMREFGELREGYKGIREPRENAEQFVYSPEDARKILMLMPGAVFDKNRNRIGYGKGFYDRFLCDKEELWERTIGIGFRCQLVEEIPTQVWDIRPAEVRCV